MKYIYSIILFLLMTLAYAKGGNMHNKQQWQTLFPTTQMSDWQQVGAGQFVLENGFLRSEGGMGLFWYSKEKFGNCRLRIVYKTTHATTNSGVFVRIADKPKDEWYAVHHGYEIQILDQAPDTYHKTGAIYSMTESQLKHFKNPGEWNVMEIDLHDQTITVYMNGEQVSQLTPKSNIPPQKQKTEPKRGPRPIDGYIGVQNHDHDAKEPNNHIYIREISVRAEN